MVSGSDSLKMPCLKTSFESEFPMLSNYQVRFYYLSSIMCTAAIIFSDIQGMVVMSYVQGSSTSPDFLS